MGEIRVLKESNAKIDGMQSEPTEVGVCAKHDQLGTGEAKATEEARRHAPELVRIPENEEGYVENRDQSATTAPSGFGGGVRFKRYGENGKFPVQRERRLAQ